MDIFDEALKTLQEAIDYEQGDKNKGRSVNRVLKPVLPIKKYSGEDIKRIRESRNYTQAYFGALVGVSLKCVQSWEYNKSKPNGSARRLISLIEKDEQLLKEAEIIA